MYLFLPVINKGIAYLKKSELRNVFMSLIFIYIIEKDIMNPRGDPFRMGSGYSSIWLLICFLMGAYFGKFKYNYHGFKKFICFVLYLNIFYYSTYFCYNISFYSYFKSTLKYTFFIYDYITNIMNHIFIWFYVFIVIFFLSYYELNIFLDLPSMIKK